MLTSFKSNYFKKNIDKIILLQRIIRKMHKFKKNILYQLDILLKECNRIIYHINKIYDISIIDGLEYNKILRNIEEITNKILNLNTLSLKEISKLSNYRLLINIVKIKLELISIIKNYGSKDILGILEFNYNIAIAEKFNQKYLNLIEFYNSIFIPTKIDIYTYSNKVSETNDLTLNLSDKLDYPTTFPHNFKVIFYKINGAKLYLPVNNILIIFSGYFIDDSLSIIKKQNFLFKKYEELYSISNNSKHKLYYINYINYISLKDFIILDIHIILKNILDSYNDLIIIKSKNIITIINNFINNDILYKRYIISILVLDINSNTSLNIIYLLIDLLKYNTSFDFTSFYKSLPWSIKTLIKDNKSKIQKKIQNLSDKDLDYEQKIKLIKCSDIIKSKAYIKLKDFNNSKNGDVNSKAQHYLDGFSNIPFNVYKELKIKTDFLNLTNTCHYYNCSVLEHIKNNSELTIFKNIIDSIKNNIDNLNNKSKNKNLINLTLFYNKIKNIIDTFNNLLLEISLLFLNSKDYFKNKKMVDIKAICKKIGISQTGNKQKLIDSILTHKIKYNTIGSISNNLNIDIKHIHNIEAIYNNLVESNTHWLTYKKKLKLYFKNIDDCLDNAIYGLDTSKKEIKRIIAQWINGQNSGYVLGLEGPPGIGKTTLAKRGISQCLIDNENTPRPFIFISVGGSANGTTLEGHNYTYVGSTWGKIVDALMETQCMNPIIYIDELDKISNTSQGREIIGILTHLTDSSQNDQFTDKYFAGIPFDLSKALIIFSYNDYTAIDKILLDRIHRIKINSLTINEKIIIVKNYILPELLNTIGLDPENIIIDDTVIRHIITVYTYEAGVRKVKEKLYEILREINLNFLADTIELPVTIDIDYINALFTNHLKHTIKKINNKSQVGVINGLYASNNGLGGITIIEVFKKISSNFLQLELTGHQGDVMKESMSVSRTMAWNLLKKEVQDKIIKDKSYGIHIHCPDTSTSKDGPSAGIAITLGIISLFTGSPINNTVAITGEIDLNANSMKIGGLEAKIDGAKEAGVSLVLCPEENKEDLEKIRVRDYPPEDDTFKVITIKTLSDALKYVFTKDIYNYLNL